MVLRMPCRIAMHTSGDESDLEEEVRDELAGVTAQIAGEHESPEHETSGCVNLKIV